MKKVCLVTGSTCGIGLAIAKKLSKNNIVIINDYKDIDKDFILKQFEKSTNVVFFKADISNNQDVLNLKRNIIEKFGKLDCLVSNAGIIPTPCGIDDITDENIDKTINVNLKGTFKCLQILGNTIKETSKHGSIVNITSVDGIIGEPFAVIYSANGRNGR